MIGEISGLQTRQDKENKQDDGGRAHKIDKLARNLSNSSELPVSSKHRLYKLIQENGEILSVDGETGLTDKNRACYTN